MIGLQKSLKKRKSKLMVKIFLKKGKQESIKRFHPWIFSGAIASASGDIEEGDLVELYSAEKEFLGVGHSAQGSIAVRILSFTQRAIDGDFFRERIIAAYKMRERLALFNENTNAYRLIHGEGDLLPGLIVDIYNRVAVMQTHSVGMHLMRGMIADAIMSALGGEIDGVYDKSEGTLPNISGIDAKDGFLAGDVEQSSDIVKEGGVSFKVDWQAGQKTGFFLDQRDNRELVRRYAAGRKVLNTFCYTGGFSLYALDGGAAYVESVDSSQRAVDLASENVKLNFGADAPHKGVCIDAFDYLKKIPSQFDLIILDPPAFAKHHKALKNAMQGYRRINAAAISAIAPGGILFTFSCSQAVSKEQFRTSIFSAAAMAGRKVRVLHQLTQGADHPVNIYHPEGEYLKGLVLYIE